MHKLTTAIIAMLACTSATAQLTGYYPKGGADVAAEDVSIIQLIANPLAYDGKVIRIIGYLHLEFEGNVLFLHEEDYRHALDKNGLWIDLPRDISEVQKTAVNDQYVICTARFVAKGHGHMGLNSGEIAEVTRLEVWSIRGGGLPPPPPPLPKVHNEQK